jgi:hypothetical protein
MPLAQSVNLVEHPSQYVRHVLAAWYSGAAPETVEPAPVGQLVQLSQCSTSPIPEVDLGEPCSDLNLELLADSKRPCGLERALKGAAVNGGKWDRPQTASEAIRLFLADIVQMYSRTSTRNGKSHRITEGMSNEDECRHCRWMLGTVKEHSLIVT